MPRILLRSATIYEKTVARMCASRLGKLGSLERINYARKEHILPVVEIVICKLSKKRFSKFWYFCRVLILFFRFLYHYNF